MNWSKTDDAMLRNLWEVEGRSASQCAQEFGVSRNAVIGRVFRLKLKQKLKPKQEPKPRQRQRKKKPKLGLRQDEPCSATNVTLLELERHHCRWIVRPGYYCGRHIVPGYSYCEEHCRRSHTEEE